MPTRVDQCRFPSVPAQHPTTASASGYWLVTSDGVVHPFGAATSYGSMSDLGSCSAPPVVSIAASRRGHGDWLLQPDGRVRVFGDAEVYGDASAYHASTVALEVMP